MENPLHQLRGEIRNPDHGMDVHDVGWLLWGDPILPQNVSYSKERSDDPFIWRLASIERVSDDSYLEDALDNVYPSSMSFPIEARDAVCLLPNAGSNARNISTSTFDGQRDNMQHSNFSIPYSTMEFETHEDSNTRDQCRNQGLILFSDLFDDRDQRVEHNATKNANAHTACDSEDVDWSVEVKYDLSGSLSFGLRASSGACLHLKSDEIMESLEAILDDSLETTLFRVVTTACEVMMVESNSVYDIVSRMLVDGQTWNEEEYHQYQEHRLKRSRKSTSLYHDLHESNASPLRKKARNTTGVSPLDTAVAWKSLQPQIELE